MSAGHGVLSTGAHRAGSLRSEGSNSPQGGSGSNTPTRHGSRDQTQQGSSGGPPASKKIIGRRGRATLAETWALSGKEAMALALSQGRFDRQMERHTEGLRTDLQASLDQAEGRLMEALQVINESVNKKLEEIRDAVEEKLKSPSPSFHKRSPQ